MNKLKELVQWFVYSSANPEKVALTVKAGVAVLVLFGVDQTTGDLLAEGIIGFIFNLTSIIASAAAIFGAVRKIGITIKTKLGK